MAGVRIKKEIENPYSTGENFADLFEKTAANLPEEDTVVKGKIVSIEKDNVIVDIGLKTEGRVSVKDFPLSERDEIKAGDEVEVYLERIENSRSEAVISRERAVREESWERLEKFHK